MISLSYLDVYGFYARTKTVNKLEYFRCVCTLIKGATTFSKMTLSIKSLFGTLTIMPCSIKGLFAMIGINET